MAKVSLAAAIAAKRYGSNATNFGYLAVGEKFRHVFAPTVYVKLSDLGWYVEADAPKSQKWRTSAGTAVIKVKE